MALALVFLAFPNPLRVPNNNPNATAELAPVPGKQNSQQNSNFSETGLATSGGLGAGTQEGAAPPPPQIGKDIPLDKDCAHNSQTEDWLSPPCIPFYAGDNGGSTYTGVSPTEVKVVLYEDVCKIQPGKEDAGYGFTYRPSDECGDQSSYETVNLIKTIKAQLGYFNRRFQLYGRAVHLYIQSGQGSSLTARQNDANVARYLWHPFGDIYLGDNAQDYFRQMAQPDEHGQTVQSFGLNFDVQKSYYESQDTAGKIWSFTPDQETEAEWSASFLCRKLNGGTAKFSSDPQMQKTPRKFALLYPKTPGPRGSAMIDLANLLIADAKQECNLDFDIKRYSADGAGAASGASLTMAQLQQEGVTTVVCYCIPVQPESAVSKFQTAATQASYYPEWFWDSASAMDRAVWHQVYGRDGSGRQNSLGVTYFWRMPQFKQQFHYKAYQEQTKDGSTPNSRWNFTIYHLFMNLFTALQAAGPTLDPQHVEQGMFTFQYHTPASCNKPASFTTEQCQLPTGSYGDGGPSRYTFIDTAMGWWWDQTGTPPGGKPGEGCFRVVQNGRRFYGEHPPGFTPPENEMWTRGDSDLFTVDRGGDRSVGPWNAPCTEDSRKITDPSAADLQ
ncbi:MAG: hypothetical protein ABR552_05590 [Actinomycetota bacterium]